MYAVGNVRDGPLPVSLPLLQQRLPHLPGHVAMQTAHAICKVRRTESEGRHVEYPVVFAEREKAGSMVGEWTPCSLEVMFDPIETECVVTRGDGRMRREDRCGSDRGERFIEAHAFGDVLVNALQHHECG